CTGKEQKITITSSSGLSKNEVEKFVKDAESHASEDRERREEIEAKNHLDSLVYNVEKMLNENRDKISGSDVSNLESAISEARKAMEQGGTDNIKRATENLTKASHKLAERYNIHPQTLRLYEREGLIKPARTAGNTRLYGQDEIKKLEMILALTRDLGVNLAGVEVILSVQNALEDARDALDRAEDHFEAMMKVSRQAV